MKASDLRLGNLVVYNGSVFRVTRISKNIITADRGKGDVEFSINDLSPLRITEFWLLKFGFKRYPWGLVTGNLLFKDKDHKLDELTLEVGNGFRVRVEFIHQLQNVYHSLSGNEFEFDSLK